MIGKRAKIDKFTLIGLLFFIVVVVTWSVYGVFRGNPGAIEFLRLFTIWPVLYYILLLPINTIKLVKWFFDISAISLFMISIYVLYIFGKEYGFPIFPPFEIDLGTAVGIHEGYSQITSHNIGMLSFLIPLFISVIIHNDLILFKKSWIIKYLVFLSAIAAILSGRRVLLINIFLSPFLIGIISKMVSPKLSQKTSKYISAYSIIFITVALLCAFLLASFTGWDIDNFSDRMSIFTEGGDDVRKDQGNSLIESFLESPLIGKGPGVGVGLLRSFERSWSYELTYHLLLHNLGLVGFTLFFAPYVAIFNRVIKLTRSNYDHTLHKHDTLWPLHLLSGSIGMMIASGSNPYLYSFDFFLAIFCLFIPINALNVGTTAANRTQSNY